MKSVRLGRRSVGPGQPTFIIAEAGVNHNGDVTQAFELIRAAKKAGADCVKFQTFSAEQVATKTAPKAAYQIEQTDPQESQLSMLKGLELPKEAYPELVQACRDEEILFLSTPYHFEDVDFLDDLGVEAFKIASGQAVEPSFLEYVASKGKPVILSSGMCQLAEVEAALYAVRKTGNEDIILLQCTSDYPCAHSEINLRVIPALREQFRVLTGFSDHSSGMVAPLLSVALGACLIEKHFTLSQALPGPDHASSLNPEEMKELILQLREAEKCMGSSLKAPTPSELKNLLGMRRSLVAKEPIPKGALVTEEHFAYKRPLSGLSPQFSHEIIGKRALCAIEADEALTPEKFH